MDRRQKIMRLIIEALAEYEHIDYNYTGAVTISDPNLILLEFTVRKGIVHGELNVRGLIDLPLVLKAQYDNRSQLNDRPTILEQIEKDLQVVSAKINRIL